MKQAISSLLVGFVFAVGLGVAGMTNTQKVIGFLDLSNWDPSLLFVMIGAILVHAVMYPLIIKRKSPLLTESFQVPNKKEITFSLVFGSLIFGMGWGIAGFCPGPALTSLASGNLSVLLFVVMMLTGMFAFRLSDRFLKLNR